MFEKEDGPQEKVVASPREEYNRLYEQLVCETEGEYDEMVGMIAYGEYKRKKNQFFARYFTKNKSKPKREHIDNFMLEYHDEETRRDLMVQARKRLYLFTEGYADAKMPAMLEKAQKTEIVRIVSDKTTRISTTVKKHTHWQRGLLLSIGGAFIYSIIVAALIFSVSILQPNSPLSIFLTSLSQESSASTTPPVVPPPE